MGSARVGPIAGTPEVWGFWEGKRPCWEMCQRPEMIRGDCPAPKHQSLPCWEIEGTYCKLEEYGTRGDDLSICKCAGFARGGVVGSRYS
jgi:hypothetical protein